MSLYAYKALNAEGKTIKGVLSVPSVEKLELFLKQQGRELICARKTLALPWAQGQRWRKPSDALMLEFFIQLKCLTQGKIPLLESLIIIQSELKAAPLKGILQESILDIENGFPFAKSLALHGDVFDQVTIGLLQMGETIGSLPPALSHIIHHLKWKKDIKSKAKRALSYPVFLMGVMLLTTALLLTVLVPQIIGFYESMGRQVPASTRVLKEVADFLTTHWLFLLLASCGVYLLLRLLSWLSKDFKTRMDGLKLSVPLWGKLYLMINFLRYFHVLSLLHAFRVELLKSLKIAGDVVENLWLKEKFIHTSYGVQQGESLSKALAPIGLMPPAIVRILKVGEHSGQLPESLDNIVELLERDVASRQTKLLKYLEPALIMLMGGVMAWIAVGTLYPLYDSFTTMDF